MRPGLGLLTISHSNLDGKSLSCSRLFNKKADIQNFFLYTKTYFLDLTSKSLKARFLPQDFGKMPRVYIRKTPDHGRIPPEAMQRAVDEVNQGGAVRTVAKRHGIPRSTLRSNLKKAAQGLPLQPTTPTLECSHRSRRTCSQNT
ncbi:hypothetical protein PoB_007360000 [Plakobranchus ocellatus]|uniref:HTH psq-type domain-containing protein n=1 Tax=Plakobranchus ocellatus TaxID=259542 RepID=A0AAV4DSH5_9GAST|nr:hypothetical protein PoB_007360000 [Plakobranchus ocellatus]